jgi:hypothetical protein
VYFEVAIYMVEPSKMCKLGQPELSATPHEYKTVIITTMISKN